MAEAPSYEGAIISKEFNMEKGFYETMFLKQMKQIIDYQNLIAEMIEDLDADKREEYRNKYIALLEQLKQK
jgi:aspartate/glutamate racemase